MWWNRTQPPLVQPPAAAAPSDLEERIERLERRQKLLEADADVWISKYRTLLARTEKAAGRMERLASQDDPGSTIITPADPQHGEIRGPHLIIRAPAIPMIKSMELLQ